MILTSKGSFQTRFFPDAELFVKFLLFSDCWPSNKHWNQYVYNQYFGFCFVKNVHHSKLTPIPEEVNFFYVPSSRNAYVQITIISNIHNFLQIFQQLSHSFRDDPQNPTPRVCVPEPVV